MRIAPLWLAVLAACAHGKDAGAVDSGTDDDAPLAQDSDTTCGGLPCDAIYVSKTGNDSATGTRADPLKTIGAGIAKAATRTPPVAVYVAAGEYDETVTMKPGVDVYGGYDASWAPSTMATEIVGPSSGAVLIDQITVPTALHKVTVRSGDATAAGASSYAVIVTGSRMITLDAVIVQPGRGADGVAGIAGITGGSGGNGGAGGAGQEHSGGLFCDSHTVPSGGIGGGSPCGMNGGRGGDPGVGDGGGASGASIGAIAGGGGGAGGGQGAGICNGGGRTAGDGFPGANGAPGGNGMNGVGGSSVGVFVGALYMTSDGTSGTPGGNGTGGAGGGGGGGGTADCDSSGSSGGGGGGGGCGGTGGTGGGGGGGPSAAAVCVGSATITIPQTMLNGGTGGTGGASIAAPGADGVSTRAIGCSFF